MQIIMVYSKLSLQMISHNSDSWYWLNYHAEDGNLSIVHSTVYLNIEDLGQII